MREVGDSQSHKSFSRSKSSQNLPNTQEEWELTNLDYIVHWLECIFSHATSSVHLQDSESVVPLPDQDDNPIPAVAGLQPGDVHNQVTQSLPCVFVVGTKKNSLDGCDKTSKETLITEKFNRIKEAIISKPYYRLVQQNFLAVDCVKQMVNEVETDEADHETEEIGQLRKVIGETGWKIQLVSHQVPFKWLQLRARLAAKAHEGFNFLSLDQVRVQNYASRRVQEVIRNPGFGA